MEFPVSTTVAATDKALYFTIGISIFFTVAITLVMIYFVIRYSRKRNPVSGHITGNFWLETMWTVVPTILVLMMFWYGYVSFAVTRNTPPGSLVVQVASRMWAWNFEYPNKKQSQVLYVPLGHPVDLILNSSDVIHSFYVPAFRFKHDVVPGQINHITFTPLEAGTFDVFCAEYCGVGHSAMNTSVVVMPPREFNAWYNRREEQKPINVQQAAQPSPAQVQRGEEIYLSYCVTCHGPTGRGENLPAARNFSSLEGWKRGAKISQMYQTVTEGLGEQMPAFPNIPVEDRFAVTHYVRQTFIKQQAPPTSPAELAQLDRQYSLSKGALAPPELTVSQAIARLVSESSATLQTRAIQPPSQGDILRFQNARQQLPGGATLYDDNCARCHGEYAQGQRQALEASGLRPTWLDSVPLNRRNASWTDSAEVLRQRVLETSISTGGLKPSFTHLNKGQWQSLFDFLKTLSPQNTPPSTPPPAGN